MCNLAKLKNKANHLTTKPGIYIMKNDKNKIIYIGKAKNLKNRVTSYFRKNKSHNEKVIKMVENIYDFEFLITNSEFEALILECSLIKEHKPKYNILLKDSKGYKYIKISNEEFPKICVTNKKLDDDSEYIGPYTNSYSVKKAVEEVNKIFMLPTCKLNFSSNKINKRPCLNFYIKRCMGLCRKNISKDEYLKTIKEAINYLKNGNLDYVKKLKKDMQLAVKNEDFEVAIKLRDKIFAIEKINQTQNVFLNKQITADVIAFFCLKDKICFVILKIKNGKIYDKEDYVFKKIYNSNILEEEFLIRYYYKKDNIPKNIFLDFNLSDFQLYEKYLNMQANHKVNLKIPQNGIFKKITNMAKLNAKEILILNDETPIKENAILKELKIILNLKEIPNYIEAYDISNFGDSAIVGGMVVFKNGIPYKKNYRKFKIKTKNTRDDYASLREIISRRIDEYKKGLDESFKQKPDLILIDGGKGHVLTVKKIFEKENFFTPYFGLVKNEKHKTRAICSHEGEISVNLNKQVFLFLSKIQEEVHRFTISFQKKLHEKNNLKLNICSIKGIGEKTATKILKHCYEEKNLNIEKIAQIGKISLEKAEKIYDILI